MAHARGAKEEDGAGDLGNSRLGSVRDPQPDSEDEVSRSILVSNIPEGVTRDKLEIHFMKTSNGGADIESITMVTDTQAKITYEESAVVERVLDRPHVLNGVEVKVQKWTPPEDDTKRVKQASRSILVSDIPEGMNEDKLQIHFMRASNGGGEIKSITMVTDTVAIITYLDSAAVKTVLEKQHVFNGKAVTVQEEDDPEVFYQVHATLGPGVAHLLPQDQIDKVKKETGITWEKGVVDGVIGVKGTYKQVADAQQLLQQYLEQYCKQALESTNESTTTAHKESKATKGRRQAPNDRRKETKAAKRNLTVTGLDDESPGNMDMDPQSTRIKPSDEAEDHLNLNTVSKDRGGCRKGQQADGEMSSEDTPSTTASNQDASVYLQSDKEAEEEEYKMGASSQEKNTGPEECQMNPDHAAGRKQEERDPQQPGKQVEDDTRSPAYERASSTSDDKQNEERLRMASGTSNEEGSSRGSADKDKDIEASAAPEELEKMETEDSPSSVHANSPPQPLSDDDEPMLSDNDEPQTQTSSNSSPPRDPRKDVNANPPDDAANNDARREEDERHQQPGEQAENAAKSPPAYEGASSPSDDKEKEERLKMASRTSDGEGSRPRRSTEEDEGTEVSTAAEEPEKMETEATPNSVHTNSPPQRLSDNDEQLLSDNNPPQTQTSSNSSPPEKPRKDEPANPPHDGHVPGSQTITRGIQAESAGSIEREEDNLKPTPNHDASPNDSTTTETGSQQDESPANNDAEVTQSRRSEKQKKAFFKENLGKNFMPVDQLSPSATDTTGNLPTGKEHKGDSADYNASTGSSQEDDSQFEVFVDPDILTYIRHKHHTEITDIGQRYKSVFHTSLDNTKAYFVPSPSLGRHPEPEKAIDEFTTIYQQVFHKITCESLNVVQYKLAPKFLLEGVRKVRQLHPEVLTKTTDDDTTVMFMGEPEKIRAARADFCGLMAIPVSRGSRRRGKNQPTSAESAGGRADAPKGAEGGENFGSPEPVLLFTHNFEQGVDVKIAHGNITTLKVDAIVNAADAQLKHGGGVAKAIVMAGGDIIQKESTEKMKTRGILKPSETEITGAGSLPCKNIIHAHGPKWQGDSQAKHGTEMLTQTCINILQAAEGLKAKSVAIPAISSGKYGMPKHVCAQALLSGVLEYLSTKHTPSCSLRNIWFIDMTAETIQVLAEIFATEISVLQSPGGKAKSTPAVRQSRGASQPQVSNPPQAKTYASAAAKGAGKAKLSSASGQAVPHRNDSSQVAALIAPGKGPGCAQQVWQMQSRATGAGGSDSGKTSSGQPNTGKEKCPICLSVPTKPRSLPCKHQGCKAVFCKTCLDKAMKTKSCCPVCSAVVGTLTGNQPEGRMTVTYNRKMNLDGYKQAGAIIIEYVFRDGIQGPEHPNPGKPYTGTTRTAYLPYNADGIKVLGLLKQAFDQKLTFTIGTSSTTGHSDTVIWNDIHHKTRTYGGSNMHGYPDPGYLKRVTEELAAKGIK